MPLHADTNAAEGALPKPCIGNEAGTARGWHWDYEALSPEGFNSGFNPQQQSGT